MNALLESQMHEDARRREHGLIYGFDTSLAHFGYAVATDFDGPLRFVAVGVLVTKPESKSKRETKAADNRRRFEGLAGALRDIVKRGVVRALCVEATAFVHGQTRATSLLANGRARGLVDSLAAEHRVTAQEFHSQTLKKAVTGDRSADKATVIAGMIQLYPELGPLLEQLNESNREHAADAAAAIHAAHAAPTTEEF